LLVEIGSQLGVVENESQLQRVWGDALLWVGGVPFPQKIGFFTIKVGMT